MARAFAAGMGAAFMATLGFVAFFGLVIIAGHRAFRNLDARIGKNLRSIPITMVRIL